MKPKLPPIRHSAETHPYQLQCWCAPTRNFEPLFGCEYETKEQGLAVFDDMLKSGRAIGVRLVKRTMEFRGPQRMVAQGPMPSSYFTTLMAVQNGEAGYEEPNAVE